MMKIRFVFIGILVFLTGSLFAQQPLFRNHEASVDARVDDLLHLLRLNEKVSLLGYNSPGVQRLQIPAYNWWNEALHGIARGGEATVFPQAIAMAATFNEGLIVQVSSAISTEARAKYNLTTAMGRRLQYMGLTFWTPNINIFRDPRWGRGQETYGEDPFLTASMGTAFVKGLQGNDPHYLKTAACAKHFAVHSGPEAERHSFNAIVDDKDLRETYLYAFKKLVDSGVEAVMCGYNRLNNQPCCTGQTLLQDILRNEWHFKGHVVTDCWALDDIWLRHKVIPTRLEVAAAAVKAGVNLDCANILQDDVLTAVQKGLLTEQEVDQALRPNLRTQMKLGFFDDPSIVPYKNYGADSVHNAAHVALARKVAQQSMVLLKNNGVLPLQKDHYASLLVAGANASSLDALMGNYHGISGNMVTFAEGITREAGPATDVQYDLGCNDADTVHFGGIWASTGCDATIAVIGLTPILEGEEGDAFLSVSGGDKATLELPAAHIAFLKQLRKASNKPVIAVVTAGSAVDIAAIEPYADAIILAWYPGEQGGSALADILFGKVSPSGRLPVTFYRSVNDLPDFKDYAMKGRTYRYFSGKVQYPFGFGLSYTSFSYSWKTEPKRSYVSGDTVQMTVQVQNPGYFDGDEVVQAYIAYPQIERMPLKELKAFKRVSILKGTTAEVKLSIPVSELQKWDLTTGKWKLYKGQYSVMVGKNSEDFPLKKQFLIK
ncbi:MAG: glycoside hydrolase family 3 N-terminal domain-containing protein [Bacteroidota bacterium]|nr:glycoside hydrolase family 3 N-terminal domain-containing protein [Bacteroidota bacterium]